MSNVVYVVMGNDYPDAVFSSGGGADAYCERMRAEPSVNPRGTKIYWRSYVFEVDEKLREERT